MLLNLLKFFPPFASLEKILVGIIISSTCGKKSNVQDIFGHCISFNSNPHQELDKSEATNLQYPLQEEPDQI